MRRDVALAPFRVALTVDAEHPDRPHNLVGREDALLEQLGELDVRATFFIQGRWPAFRSPFGAGASDPNVRDALAELGYRQVLWSASGDDWEPDKTPAAVEDDLVGSAIAHGDGAILLLHTWPSHTHATIRSTVARLRAAGAELVTLDALEPESIPDRWADEEATAADRPAT